MNKELISKDDLEYIQAVNEGYEGWLKLSSGKTVYVSLPRCTAKEAGNAFRSIINKMHIDEEKWKREYECTFVGKEE